MLRWIQILCLGQGRSQFRFSFLNPQPTNSYNLQTTCDPTDYEEVVTESWRNSVGMFWGYKLGGTLWATWSQLCGIQHQPQPGGSSGAVEDSLPSWSTKWSHPSSPNDCRPVALIAHIMKVLEKLLLVHLNKKTSTFQSAYHHGVGVEDAIIHMLQQTHSQSINLYWCSSPLQ